MTTTRRRASRQLLPGRRLSSIAGTGSVFVGLGLVLAGLATPATAADVRAASTVDAPAVDGLLDWGVKDSFRDYVEGPIADGHIEVYEPASRNADGTFRFADGTGVLDAEAGSAAIDFGGEVYFEGHGEGEAAQLRLWITDPRLEIAGTVGEVVVDLRALSGTEIVEYVDLSLAELDLTGVSLQPDPDGIVSVTGIPATLTDEGAPAFGGFYEAGEAMDAVSFSVTVSPSETPSPTPTPTEPTSTPTSTPTSPPTQSPTSTPSETTPTAPPVPTPSPSATWEEGEISSGLLDWGFKESFLSYISGGIANGGWTTDDVDEVNGVFRWTAAYGDYDMDAGSGRASFVGSVHFTGHDGALDVKISRPQVRFDAGGTAVLLLDVVSKSLEDEGFTEQQAVEFATLDLSAATAANDADSISYAGVPVTLTAAGATGFGGFYEAGTELDPLTVVFGVGGAEVPGGGSAGGPGDDLAFTGGSAGLASAGGVLVLLGLALVLASRRQVAIR